MNEVQKILKYLVEIFIICKASTQVRRPGSDCAGTTRLQHLDASIFECQRRGAGTNAWIHGSGADQSYALEEERNQFALALYSCFAEQVLKMAAHRRSAHT